MLPVTTVATDLELLGVTSGVESTLEQGEINAGDLQVLQTRISDSGERDWPCSPQMLHRSSIRKPSGINRPCIPASAENETIQPSTMLPSGRLGNPQLPKCLRKCLLHGSFPIQLRHNVGLPRTGGLLAMIHPPVTIPSRSFCYLYPVRSPCLSVSMVVG